MPLLMSPISLLELYRPIPSNSPMNNDPEFAPRASGTSDPDDAPSTRVQVSPPGEKKAYEPHEFDPQVAELYGIPAALILQHICWRSVNKSKWVVLSVNDLAEQYPYMGRDECWRGLNRLLRAGKKTPALVHRKAASQGCGYVYSPTFRPRLDLARPHTFNVRVAEKHGLVPAIIHHNVGFWIKKNWMQKAEELYQCLKPEDFDWDEMMMQRFAYQHTRRAAAHHCSIEKWIKHHKYVSLPSAKRGFLCLRRVGLLEKGRTRARIPIWFLPRNELVRFEQEILSKSDLGNEKLKTKRVGSKPNSLAQSQTTEIKTKQELPVTDSNSEESESVKETPVEEGLVALRAKKPVGDNSDAFRTSSSLATASDTKAGTASAASATPSASVLAEAKKLNRPNLPKVKKKSVIDSFSKAKRKYLRVYSPDDPRYDLDALENLTPEEFSRYLEKAKEKKAAGKIYVQANGSAVEQSSGY